MSESKPHSNHVWAQSWANAYIEFRETGRLIGEGADVLYEFNEDDQSQEKLARIIVGLFEQLEAARTENEDAINRAYQARDDWKDEVAELKRLVALQGVLRATASALDDAIGSAVTANWSQEDYDEWDAARAAAEKALSNPASSLPEYIELEGTLADGLDDESNQEKGQP